MEPMEFREVCRWNNNGNSDDVFSGESKGTKEGDDGGVESVADEGAAVLVLFVTTSAATGSTPRICDILVLARMPRKGLEGDPIPVSGALSSLKQPFCILQN